MKKIFRSITLRKLFNNSQKRKVRIIGNFPNQHEISKFLLIGLPENAQEIKEVYDVLSSKGFENIAVVLHSKNNLEQPAELKNIQTYTFATKDTNWIGIPKDDVHKSLISTDFHMLINFSNVDVFLLKYLTAKINSTFKVGKYQQTEMANLFDFMVDNRNNEYSTESFLGEINRFFKLYK